VWNLSHFIGAQLDRHGSTHDRGADHEAQAFLDVEDETSHA
jgi:hypothetical protein